MFGTAPAGAVMDRAKRVLSRAVYVAIFAYLILPILVIVPLSFSASRYLQFPPPGWSLEWYRTFFGDAVWLAATKNSLLLGATVAPIATLLGTLAAVGLVGSRFPGRGLVLACLMSPMIVPEIVVAAALYGVFSRLGLIGSFTGVVLAHTALAIPLVTLNVAASLQRVDVTLERAAQSLGADPVRAFLKVTLPNIWPGIMVGGLFAFRTSFDELIIVLFISGQLRTIPRKIWEDLVVLIEPTQAAASVILMTVSLVIFATVALMQRRGGAAGEGRERREKVGVL